MLGGKKKMYCGYTNNPRRRWGEHCKRGFLGTKEKFQMRIISTHTTQKLVMNEESRVKKLSAIKKYDLYENGDPILSSRLVST